MPVSLEKRVAALEQQIARMKQPEGTNTSTDRAWIDDLYGKFAADPVFDRAMKLGRQYRKSLRQPKSKR